MASQVYVLPLDDSGKPDLSGSYVLLPPPISPYTLRFSIEGASSICRQGSLWVNIPKNGEDFARDEFHEYKLSPDFTRALTIDIPIERAGSYSFYTTYSPLPPFSSTGEEAHPKPTKTDVFYICVSPNLTINQKEALPLDALIIFSVISKWLGPMSAWDGHMSRISNKGYNMVHFTPMMYRGESNSPYSIFSQITFDPTVFPGGTKDVQAVVGKMEKQYNLLSLTDVVWNHTANNSEWLQDHPDAGYNMFTAPWLESAYELDTALLKFSRNLGRLGFPTDLKNTGDLLRIMDGIKTHALGAIRLWEYYVVDVERDAEAGVEAWKAGKGTHSEAGQNLTFQQKSQLLSREGLRKDERLGERFRRTVDPAACAGFLLSLFGPPSTKEDELEAQEASIKKELAKYLDEVNLPFYKEYDEETGEIMEQLYNRIKYVRLDDHGPKQGPITDEFPLIESYFTRLPANKRTAKFQKEELAVANNGWIWNANPLVDFAGPTSRAYLRREVIVWADCVKLRFGKGPEDSPFLWEFMKEYTQLMAQVFHGFRIDNCHSTPLHVAEYLLDAARRVRPNLYVVAELFSGSEEMDYVFVQRLGLNSLIREAMQAWGPGELSRLVHRHGGKPIGSFEQENIRNDCGDYLQKISSSPIHALFMDCTHDNETPSQKRVPEDTLPNGALVAMCACATGSVMGYDEVYPKLLDLVNETRLYSTSEVGTNDHGIGDIKKVLNKIHVEMGKEGFNETHIHHEGEYITVHRVHPKTHKGYFLVAHTAFSSGTHRGDFNPVVLTGTKAKSMLTAKLVVQGSDEKRKEVLADKDHLMGLPSEVVDLAAPTIKEEGETTTIVIPDEFPPGSIALFETWIPTIDMDGLQQYVTSGAGEAVSKADLPDLNFILYRCDVEERDHSNGEIGVYTIPNHGALVYAGLQGWWSVLRDIIKNNDLGHPLCQHLREGTWALDYVVTRLQKLFAQGYGGLEGLAGWLKSRCDKIKELPSFLIPRYFALVIQTAYSAAWDRGIELLGDNVKMGHEFVRSLAMVSVQMTGYMKSASLFPKKKVPCLAAGLPHFANDYMRCWGRDVFISVRGLYLATGRFEDAKQHIFAFASVLKHGMIPNLLDGGNNPRYNSRDSIWFFLQSIQDYVRLVPDGISLLQEKVKRRFLPFDDTWFGVDDSRTFSKESTIEEIIFEALQRHASGMSFTEANAGPGIDSQMKWEGFLMEIKTDWKTGIIFGGSQWNCGTWMDKMGESETAGNKGFPGTPRDGAAIEITGMLYSTLRWVQSLNKAGKFSYKGVEVAGKSITFATWADKIKASFEKCYYVPTDAGDDSWYDVNPKIVNRRGIYKDLYKSGKEYEDYQLRPNFAIAMAVAPDLFEPAHALNCIRIADEFIRGPTGMATLDPADLNYRPYYNNAEDSHDFATSKGRNYHQGPEWLWPTGFFLRAFLHFDLLGKKTAADRVETFQQIHRRLEGCKKAIKESPWAGLTELTNKDGSFCGDSSPTQAWSSSCLIDLFHDAAEIYAAEIFAHQT